MADLRLCVVGLGYGAQVHVPAFRSLPGVAIAAVVSAHPAKAREFAQAQGIPRVFEHWQEAVADSSIDVVSVAVPPYLQRDVVCAATAARKHVLCEKPFGKNLADARAMWESATKAEVVGAVNFQLRMEPGISAMQREVADGTIGRIRRIAVSWLTGGGSRPGVGWSWRHDAVCGGGVLGAFGSHVIDYMEWIGAARFLSVQARVDTLAAYRPDASGPPQAVAAEDSCDFLGCLENEVICSFAISNCYRFGDGHRIEIFGDCGRLLFEHRFPFAEDCVTTQIQDATGRRPLPLTRLAGFAGMDTRIPPFREIARRFLNAARGETVPDLPGFDRGLSVQAVLEATRTAIQQSLAAPVPRMKP